MRRSGLLLAVWSVTAVTASGVGTWALSLVGDGINDRSAAPLSQSRIDEELRAATPNQPGGAGSSTTPDASQLSAADASFKGLPSKAGQVTAQCHDGQVFLVTWNPAPGYRTLGSQRGWATQAWVVFTSGRSGTVDVTVHCDAHGVPVQAISDHAGEHVDGHGGGHGGGLDDDRTASPDGTAPTGATPTTTPSDDHHRGGGSGGGSGGSPGGSGSTSSGGGGSGSGSTSGGGGGSDDPTGDRHGGD